jgi:tetratricopeptide (TPR) repeat protein
MAKKRTKKKQTSHRSKLARKGKQNIEKGRLLEQVAARMYASPFHKVTPNAELPPINRNPKLTREIDVLLESKVVTRPPKKAIECKNLNQKVGVERIDAFAGKLNDIGIAHEHGIYISPTGYTEDAIDRARPLNLQLLTLRGLTKDGLASVTADSSQLKVFYIAKVQGITVTNNVEQIGNAGDLLIFFDGNSNFCGTVADLIWNQWQAGMIPEEAGRYDINVIVPDGWRQIINGKDEPVLGIKAVVQVTALVFKIPGESTYHTLTRATDGKIEKRQLNTTFHVNITQTTVHTLEAFDSEADLAVAINGLSGIHLTIRTRLPRIQYMNRFFYPLSARVVQLLKKRWEDANVPKQSVEDLDVNDIEGTDLRAMFDPLSHQYPGKHTPVVVYDESNRTAVDVSSLLREGEHERVCQFEKYFRRLPRPELSALLHDANLIYGQKLLESSASLPRQKALRLASRARRKVLKALRFKPTSLEAHHDLGIVLQEMGLHSEAVASFDRSLILAPGRVSTLNLRAQSLRSLGRFQDALTTYDQILSLQPDNIETLYFRSGLLGTLGRYHESIEGYDAVLKAVPTQYESLYCRGLGQYNLGLYEASIVSFSAALRVRPADLDPVVYRGMAFERCGRNEESLNDYTTVLSRDPTKHELFINRGSVLRALGRYEEALADFDLGLQHHSDHTIGWNNRGATLDNLGRSEEALESYQSAIEIDPLYKMALMNCGISLSSLGHLEDALVCFDNALKLDPEDVSTLHSKGLAFYRLARFEEALQIYDRVLILNPSSYDSLANRALILAELGRLDEAVESANRALSLAPQTNGRSMLFVIRAKVSHLMSRFSDVVEDLVAAWKLDPTLILAVKDCHSLFIDSFNALPSATEEQSNVYAKLRELQTE